MATTMVVDDYEKVGVQIRLIFVHFSIQHSLLHFTPGLILHGCDVSCRLLRLSNMPAFSSKSRGSNPLLNSVRRHPFAMFGLPFLSLVVVSSYALQTFTQTRYDLNDQKVQAVSKEEELGMSKDRKKVDIREEYYVSDLRAQV